MVEKKKDVYRYYSIHRPVSIGTYPKENQKPTNIVNFDGGRQDVGDGTKAWGYLEYSKRLTKEEIEDFELKDADPEPTVSDRVQKNLREINKKLNLDISVPKEFQDENTTWYVNHLEAEKNSETGESYYSNEGIAVFNINNKNLNVSKDSSDKEIKTELLKTLKVQQEAKSKDMGVTPQTRAKTADNFQKITKELDSLTKDRTQSKKKQKEQYQQYLSQHGLQR